MKKRIRTKAELIELFSLTPSLQNLFSRSGKCSFIEIGHEIFLTAFLSPLLILDRAVHNASYELLVKGCALSTGQQLRFSLPRKSLVRISDHPNMISTVYH